jgi:RNA polymerase sigma-70 factor (ECF subfamily)
MDQPEHLNAAMKLLTANQSSLYAYILSLLASTEQTHDVLQETNLVIWRKAREAASVNEFGPWSRRVALFQVMAYRKKIGRDRLVFDDDNLQLLAEQPHAANPDMESEQEALHACMGIISPRDRELLDRRYRDGMKLQEIADRTGTTVGTIAQTLYRVRHALLECIRRRLGAEASP